MPVSQSKDYYKVLGVAKTAKMQEIKKAYRDLAKKHHPDINSGSAKSEESFKLISEAYTTLKDAKKRKQYDQMQADYARTPRGRGGGRPRGGNPWQGAYDYARQYTRQGPRDDFRNAPPPDFEEPPPFDPDIPTQGFDLQFMVDVPFVTAALGGTLPFHYEKYVTCTECGGTGLNTVQDACGLCEGTQRIVEPVTVHVDIPGGVADQYTLRMQHEGACGRNGGPPGDLLLKVCIEPHPQFRRVQSDVYADIVIPPELAENGGPLEVQTLDSTVTIDVEDGTLTGEEHRIPGAGCRERTSKKRGDFVVKFHVAEPAT
ncbi:J domain-containing protein [Nitrospina watsonii]|uniref:Chaperone protein DnaJ n=1 Tax=Nitrospina watsonii TaxID=1323948 RepID=A0ABM9HD03_9BACT|nr:J domain-containing protein [Nitrospina watsonii]CAI2718078.1 Chaperone protein DnaJ [Nitrospina watsonii]